MRRLLLMSQHFPAELPWGYSVHQTYTYTLAHAHACTYTHTHTVTHPPTHIYIYIDIDMYIGKQGGERGMQVGSMNEESQVSGCDNITFNYTNQETV